MTYTCMCGLIQSYRRVSVKHDRTDRVYILTLWLNLTITLKHLSLTKKPIYNASIRDTAAMYLIFIVTYTAD